MSPSSPRRALIAFALTAALVLPPPGTALAEEAGNPVEEGKQGGEPNAKETTKTKAKETKKSKKQERAERLKYQIGPGTAKTFAKAREHYEAQRYAEAEAAMGKLRRQGLSPHERAVAHRLNGYIS